MAQGDSATSVANIALIALGEKPLTVLSETNKNATLVNARLDDVRRFVLRSHPWRCAKRQIQLAASADAPLFKWTSKYPLPADFCRFYSENQMTEYMGIWEVMDGSDDGLVHVIAYHLASEIALPITQNPSRATAALQTMAGKLELARFINAQEASPREWDVDVLLWARN